MRAAETERRMLELEGIRVTGPVDADAADILTPDALRFVADLAREFEGRRQELLLKREFRRRDVLRGRLPDFPEDTSEVRAGTWRVAAPPHDLVDRRVEITGPADRKMIVNALNSGANVFMADFEDAQAPTWRNTVHGQIHLRDAVRRTIEHTSPDGKRYALRPETATLMVRPRGWHLPEKHVTVDGSPVSGALFDFGLFFFHNARALRERGTGPYFYLPKMESHLEARLWNGVFLLAQERLGLPRGTIRATALIETIQAAFEMDEILYELREHSAGLNCGRWDYIFSFIKTLGHRPDCVFPDRGDVTMDKPFLKAYADLLIKTCHRRGAHAIGGMSAFIPIRGDDAANAAALEKVRADKRREALAGHDGTWVAHPALVPVAREIFDQHLRGPHQMHVLRDDAHASRDRMLSVPRGAVTEAGLRLNLSVGVQYLEAWLRGTGCVPLNHMMEDAATAEISRAQIWQWLHHRVALADGRAVTPELVRGCLREELARIRERLGAERYAAGPFAAAAEIFEQILFTDACPQFMTLRAYAYLLD